MRSCPPRIVPISYVYSHTPNHAEKFDIKTAGSGLAVFEKNKGMVRGPGANVVDKRVSWRGDSETDGFLLFGRFASTMLEDKPVFSL